MSLRWEGLRRELAREAQVIERGIKSIENNKTPKLRDNARRRVKMATIRLATLLVLIHGAASEEMEAEK